MNIQIYAVFDKKVEAYLQPFFSPTLGSAIRSLQEVCNDPQHTFHKHAADYVLYQLGNWDDATGLISTVPSLDPIINLLDLVKQEETASPQYPFKSHR